MRIGFFAALALPAAFSSACTTPAYCEAGQKCGGDFLAAAQDYGAGVPQQEWVATAVDACIDQVPNPPEPPSLAYIPPRPAGIRAVEPSTIDWCSGLVIQLDEHNAPVVKAFDDGWYETLKKYNGWFPSIPLFSAQLTFSANNQYSTRLTQRVSQQVAVSKTCLVAQGVKPTCDVLSSQLQEFVSKKLGGIMGLEANVYGNACVDDGDSGCNCAYYVELSTTVGGPWAVKEGKITFFDAAAAPPGQADYCSSASSLELTGTKGVDLFNRSALKNLTLHPPTCDDDVKSVSLGETDIDCGGPTCGACQ